MCVLIHLSFRHWLEEGVIRIARHWWGARFADLYNDGDVERYVKENLEAFGRYNSEPDLVLKEV